MFLDIDQIEGALKVMLDGMNIPKYAFVSLSPKIKSTVTYSNFSEPTYSVDIGPGVVASPTYGPNIIGTNNGTYFLNTDQRYYDLNYDPDTHKRAVDYIYTKTVEKWLYNRPEFESLLKYFTIRKSDNKYRVELIDDIEKAKLGKLDSDERKAIFHFIENYYITKKFVYKCLKEYVEKYHMNWYDFYTNSGNLREFLRHELKRKIKKSIYEISKK